MKITYSSEKQLWSHRWSPLTEQFPTTPSEATDPSLPLGQLWGPGDLTSRRPEHAEVGLRLIQTPSQWCPRGGIRHPVPTAALGE